MEKLSLCMIVKDEEDVISRCLECVKKFADEIIVVDTGSSDKTKEIVNKYTDKIYNFKWCDDFSKARNYSFSKASNRYVMWLDADDVVTDENIKKIIELKNNNLKDFDVIMMKYNVSFDENDRCTYTYYRERIFNMQKKYKWESPIHEVIVPSGNISYSDICIEHRKQHENIKGRNLKIFNKMIENNIEFDARQKYYYSRELYFNQMYEEAIKSFNEFFLRSDGWIENYITACKDIALCYYQLGNNNKALESLLKSFEYDIPRADICCSIGNHFLKEKKYEIAAYWYEVATKCNIEREKSNFINIDAFRYIPYIQLCVCYYNLGDVKKSKKYNNMALREKPNDVLANNNKKILENIYKKN